MGKIKEKIKVSVFELVDIPENFIEDIADICDEDIHVILIRIAQAYGYTLLKNEE